MLRLLQTSRSLILLLAGVLMMLWMALSWYESQQDFNREFRALVETEQKQAKETSLELADSFTRNLHYVRGIPDTFRQALRVQNVIDKYGLKTSSSAVSRQNALKQWLSDPLLHDLNQYLELTQDSLGVDTVLVVNAAGDCISASNWAMPDRSIGVNYADRRWFIEARNGYRRMQYATGKTTHIAGLYFASPIIKQGQFLGVVVVKVAIPSLSFLLAKVDAFVTDVNGVIIMSHDLNRVMKIIPDAPVAQMLETERLNIYQMTNFSKLTIESWNENSHLLLKRIGGEISPRVVSSTPLSEYGLTVFTEGKLSKIPELENARNTRFWMLSLGGGLVILIAVASLLYFQSMRKVSKQITESNDNLNLLLESVDSGIWGQTSDGACTFMNQAAANMLGYRVNDFIGKSVHLLTHHSHPDGTPYPRQDCPIFRTGVDGVRRSAENEVFWRKDGSNFPIRYSSHPLYKTGQLNGVVAIFDDITELKQAQRQFDVLMREQSAMLETSLAGIGKVQNRAFTWLNTAFENMLGYDKGELIGQPTRVTYPDEQAYHDFGVAAYPVLASGKIYRAQSRLRCKDGRLIWVDLSGSMLDEGNNISFWTLNDISDIKQAELTMMDAMKSAELLAQSKSEFLANMSHEIRTPMNAIIGLSQLALNKEMSEELRDYLEKIHTSSSSLLGILNDILDFSKMEAGKLGIENIGFSLHFLTDTLRNLFIARAQEKHLGFVIRIDPRIPAMLVGDALRIQQILANLIGNALKFTAEGSVTLEVNLVELESSQARLCFSVTDSGIGLTPEDQAKLFTPFSQVDTSITRRFGGTGLGLSISHGLLQLMGGSFRIESTVGVGSSFSFELQLGITSEELHQNVRQEPIKRGAGSLSEKLQTRGEQLKGKRILVAEDNHINQLVVMEFLSLSGVIITIANNGLEALELLQQFSYDAILMDVHMPVMGGVEATAKIRQQGYTLPIIALTAGVTQEERDNCKHIGMNDFITKPVNPEELISVLCHWIATDNLPDSVVSAITEPAVEEEMPVSPPFIMALPGFDLTIVLSMVGGDEKIVHELLQIFREDLLPSLQAIEDNITASNFRAAADLAHRIKGTAGNLGGMELHSVAANLEASLKQGSLDNDVWVEFKRVMRATAIALEGI